ncbi:MAG: hypothetical protein WC869_14000 [Phycisphaerae bacterium]|jgi:hypothetical protein
MSEQELQRLLDALPPLLAAAGVIMLFAAALLRHRRLARARRAGKPDADRLAHDAAALAEQLDKFANQVEARVDDRLERLQRLLDEADARIAELRRLTGSSPAPRAAEKPGAAPAGSMSLSPVEQVLNLHDQGLARLDIARRLGMEIAQVDLTLNLYRAAASRR